jgi:hypothetical protein
MTEADFFWRALRERDLPFGGVVVNKVHPSYMGGARSRLRGRARRALVDAHVPEVIAERAAENLDVLRRRDAAEEDDFAVVADRGRERSGVALERHSVAALARVDRHAVEQRMGADAIIEVPLLDHDIHDLEGLAAVSRHLFGGD